MVCNTIIYNQSSWQYIFMCLEWGNFYLYLGFANEEYMHCFWPWSLIIWGLGESYSTMHSKMENWYVQPSIQIPLCLGALTKSDDAALIWDHLLSPPAGYLTQNKRSIWKDTILNSASIYCTLLRETKLPMNL